MIVGGEKNADGSPKYTIVNKSDNPLVNISNGCVIKDLNVIQSADVALVQTAGFKKDKDGKTNNDPASKNAAFDYIRSSEAKIKYFGGIIGEIMGGDNIIDNSYVSQTAANKVTLSGDNAMLCPVGSYVGAVVFGGLIFKNMKATTVNSNAAAFKVYYGDDTSTNLTAESSKGAIYVNPLVGRVINGYAVNETKTDDAKGTIGRFSVTENGKYHDDDLRARTGNQHSLKNNTKHYTIADINRSEAEMLDVSLIPKSNDFDGEINVPNAQALFILSLITQSCAGTATTADGVYSNSLSYGIYDSKVCGMTHLADYSFVGENSADAEADFTLAANDTAATTSVPYIIRWYTKEQNRDVELSNVSGYTARCVTSTNGYYDINLTGSGTYQLPDSFRGIGCVGIYSKYKPNDLSNERYIPKIDIFDGNGCNIDEDIYLNRFCSDTESVDNYFDRLHCVNTQNYSSNNEVWDRNGSYYHYHGVGLFDNSYTKDSGSGFYDFKVSGSVNTENYKLGTTAAGEEKKGIDNKNITWFSTGGVLGFSPRACYCTFDSITLTNLSVSGSSFTGGLLGHSDISDKLTQITVNECGASELSVEITCASDEDYRNAVAAFVGKVYEGKVIVNGGENGSTVKLKSMKSGVDNAHVCIGGLVAYAGNGCEGYNMTVMPADSLGGSSVTVGTPNCKMAGGIIGLMQPVTKSGQNVGDATCFATFENCTVEKINVTGEYAGGLYGGTHSNTWSPVEINIIKCNIIGDTTTNNTITGKTYAGGFVAYGYVQSGPPEGKLYNIMVQDSKISNYNITGQYAGGFLGFANADGTSNSVVCYVHDSAVEDCELTGNGTGNNANKTFSGGVIGTIEQNIANKLVGYNVKLSNISSENETKLGAWIGQATNDGNGKTTTIQLTGLAIYGKGIAKNIGNGARLNNMSFVFANYDGRNGAGVSDFNASNNVDMPKSPYVNINPQSSVGTKNAELAEGENAGKIISGDGAVLHSQNEAVVPGTHYVDYETSDSYLEYVKPNDLSGRTFVISNNRTDNGNAEQKASHFYIAIGESQHRTVDLTKATIFLFEMQSNGKYALAAQENNSTIGYLKKILLYHKRQKLFLN